LRARVIFILKNKGAYVPFHHQFLLAQMVKGVLMRGKEEQYISADNYNFSGLKGQTRVSRNGLHFYSSRVTLVISSDNKDFIDYFLRNLYELNQVEIGNLVLTPEFVEKEEGGEINECMKFVCISPMVLLEPTSLDSDGKKFITPLSDTFSDLLYETTMARMEKSGRYTPEEISSFYKFQLVPDKAYLSKIRNQQKKFARIYPVYDQDVKFEVRGYTFPFTLYAAKDVQEFVYTNGLGLFTHKGFGMLDLAASNPGKNTVKYDFEAVAMNVMSNGKG
jgi:CRISPR-associated endoribonuclease Cas6